MTEQVEDFLEHFGVRGMKWGNHKARSSNETSSNGRSADAKNPKPKMSKEKKIAIAIGVGAVLAIGAAVVVTSMNKNMDVPVRSILKNTSVDKGKSFVNQTASKPSASGLTLAPRGTTSKPSDSGLTLTPRGASTDNAGKTILGERLNRAGLKPSDLNRGTSNSVPQPQASNLSSLNTLSGLINGGPQVSFNPKTGQYETK